MVKYFALKTTSKIKSVLGRLWEVSGSIFGTILAVKSASRGVSGRLGDVLERLGSFSVGVSRRLVASVASWGVSGRLLEPRFGFDRA